MAVLSRGEAAMCLLPPLSSMRPAWWCLAACALGAAMMCSGHHTACGICSCLTILLHDSLGLSVCWHPHPLLGAYWSPEEKVWEDGWGLGVHRKCYVAELCVQGLEWTAFLCLLWYPSLLYYPEDYFLPLFSGDHLVCANCLSKLLLSWPLQVHMRRWFQNEEA